MLTRAYETFLATPDRPTLIIVDSHIGYGAPHRQDTRDAHGEPLGDEEARLAKVFYGWDPDAKRDIVAKVKAQGATGEGSKQHGGNATLSFATDEHMPADVATAQAMAEGRMRKLAEGVWRLLAWWRVFWWA